MSDSDQLTGSAELHELRGSLSGVAVPKPPPLDAIMARGPSSAAAPALQRRRPVRGG